MTLAALPGMGPVQLRKLDAVLDGQVERLLEMTPGERRAYCGQQLLDSLADWESHFNPEKVAAALGSMAADFQTFEEAGYPAALLPYNDAPIGLYRIKAAAVISDRAIAIVGTRRPTSYGRKMARTLVQELCARGYLIVSGMAEGIDTEAHEAALACGGQTAAFLGGGLKRCYPASNRQLMQKIAESGGVWTEFPLWRSADRRSFPQRNRLVAGVSEAVVVIESGRTGGSLITARMAAEMGRAVYALPGRADTPESAGCHDLIRDGAQLVTCAEEILSDLGHLPKILQQAHAPQARRKPVPQAVVLPEPQGPAAELWNALPATETRHPDELADQLGWPVWQLQHHLLELELSGHLCRHLDGRYERN